MHINIYTSEKILPYVYIGTHKETGQFYIGYRCANKKPSTQDLGTHYFTSSKKVKELGFENFNWIVLAEFFEATDALEFETLTIIEYIKHPLNINFYAGGKFTTLGLSTSKGRILSEEHKRKISISNSNPTDKTRKAHSDAHKGISLSEAHKAAVSKGLTGLKQSQETIEKRAMKLRRLSKENCEGIRLAAEKHNILKIEDRIILVKMKNAGKTHKEICAFFEENGIKIANSSISAIFRRNKNLLEIHDDVQF